MLVTKILYVYIYMSDMEKRIQEICSCMNDFMQKVCIREYGCTAQV